MTASHNIEEVSNRATAFLAKQAEVNAAWDVRNQPGKWADWVKLHAEAVTLRKGLCAMLDDARRVLAKNCNSYSPTPFEHYPQLLALPGNRGLVVKGSARKVQLFVMFPEVGGEEGCKMVPVSKNVFKSHIHSTEDFVLNAFLQLVNKGLAA